VGLVVRSLNDPDIFRYIHGRCALYLWQFRIPRVWSVSLICVGGFFDFVFEVLLFSARSFLLGFGFWDNDSPVGPVCGELAWSLVA
jgi:hypothetical protein